MMVAYVPLFGSTIDMAQLNPDHITGTRLDFAQEAAAFFLVMSNREQSDFAHFVAV